MSKEARNMPDVPVSKQSEETIQAERCSSKRQSSGTKNSKEKEALNESDSKLYEGLIFQLEVFQDEISMFDLFSEQIIRYGGKITKLIGKRTTHLVWSNGRLKSLLKAQEMNIQIVNPLWLKSCQ